MLEANPTLGELVLLGGGHAQVAVLRQFAMSPLPCLRLTLVTPEIRTPYSGMLPAISRAHGRTGTCTSILRVWPRWRMPANHRRAADATVVSCILQPTPLPMICCRSI